MLTISVCFALIFVPPFLLFRPLILSIADRIAGRHKGGAVDEINALKKRLAIVEHELNEYKTRVIAVEETADFSKKLIEGQKPQKAP